MMNYCSYISPWWGWLWWWSNSTVFMGSFEGTKFSRCSRHLVAITTDQTECCITWPKLRWCELDHSEPHQHVKYENLPLDLGNAFTFLGDGHHLQEDGKRHARPQEHPGQHEKGQQLTAGAPKAPSMWRSTQSLAVLKKDAVRKHEQIRDLVAANMFNKDKKDRCFNWDDFLLTGGVFKWLSETRGEDNWNHGY